jgi:hypothetical protein
MSNNQIDHIMSLIDGHTVDQARALLALAGYPTEFSTGTSAVSTAREPLTEVWRIDFFEVLDPHTGWTRGFTGWAAMISGRLRYPYIGHYPPPSWWSLHRRHRKGEHRVD